MSSDKNLSSSLRKFRESDLFNDVSQLLNHPLENPENVLMVDYISFYSKVMIEQEPFRLIEELDRKVFSHNTALKYIKLSKGLSKVYEVCS